MSDTRSQRGPATPRGRRFGWGVPALCALVMGLGAELAWAAHSSDVGINKRYRPGAGVETSVGVFEFRHAYRAELGYLANAGADADMSNYYHALGRLDWRPAWWDSVDVKLGLRLDVYQQVGGGGTEAELDYDEMFIRARLGDTRVTLGAQHVVWGRVDEIPPSDRLSVQDLSRYFLDQLPDRRRAVPAVRVEHTLEEFKADLIVVPWFRSAELPDQDSIWFPVNQTRGKILGVSASNPIFAAGVRLGTIGGYDDLEKFGGAGLRLSQITETIDYGISVQRVRHSLPYYELDPAVRAAALGGAALPLALAAGQGPTLREVHPLTWVVAADLALDLFLFDMDWTFRAEAAYVTDNPVTNLDLGRSSTDSVEWVAAVEFFPGESDTRINVQIAHRELLTDSAILDEERSINLNGEVEHPFANDRWRWTTRFSFGLAFADVLFSSEVRYVGREPHEFYLGGYLFTGTSTSANGFFSKNDLVAAGWRARF